MYNANSEVLAPRFYQEALGKELTGENLALVLENCCKQVNLFCQLCDAI